MIITQSHVVSTLRESCPSFQPTVAAFQARYHDTPEDSLPHYMLMGDLVIECSKRLSEGHEKDLEPLFELLEKWITDGDKYVQEMAIIGFIEDLQNANLHTGTQPGDFERFLHPKSEIYWTKVNRFWSHGELITKD